MRLFFRAIAATLAAAGIAEARLYRIGIPDAIKPGDPFNATIEQLAGIPLQYTMLWGIERYDEEWSVAPRPGSLGPVLLTNGIVDLQKAVGDGSVSGNTSIAGFVVPADYKLGPAAIQAVIFEIAGPLNSPIIETWWWSVNITDTSTSESLVWSNYADDNSRICQIPFQ
ncbi:hypothetical protein GL218_03032 [Daldinia childiae]|uniref:uncharacterized protein n=1 Tax=Daldinia childiae TaxID=326645 RepID=UPI0014472ED1|nr:uncharacterized protein GL218_03032 [Daldinia childiae]KAF3061576.1 hypothetical protein GL218_03032 [Daldinia childiae]